MMKHESLAKPIAIGGGVASSSGTLMTTDRHRRSATPTGKRSMWRPRSSSEAPQTPRSPITKAFDFLPWSRNKKAAESRAQQQQQQQQQQKQKQQQQEHEQLQLKTNNGTMDEEKKALNYQRNIFRNSGGLLREILSDKLVKQERDSSGTCLPSKRKSKKVVSRNKSLDINELIGYVGREWQQGEKNGTNKSELFLDDTFIEKLIRAKHEYELAHADPEPVTQQIDNIPLQRDGTPAKHILFKDENTVYLIKKELPVKREVKVVSKTANGGTTKPTRKLSNNNNNKEMNLDGNDGESVLRARLKFKKLSPAIGPHDGTILNNNQLTTALVGGGGVGGDGLCAHHQQQHHQHVNSHQQAEETVGRQQQRSILHQRPLGSNTMLVGTPQQQQQQQHYARQTQGNIGNYEQQQQQQQQQYDNSSSSSMGSVGSGLALERPKSDKPRKKLSFLEPVVVEQEKMRRRSSPLHHHHSLVPADIGFGGGGGSGGLEGLAPAYQHTNGNCDNLAVYQDNRCFYAATTAALNAPTMNTTATITTTTRPADNYHRIDMHDMEVRKATHVHVNHLNRPKCV